MEDRQTLHLIIAFVILIMLVAIFIQMDEIRRNQLVVGQPVMRNNFSYSVSTPVVNIDKVEGNGNVFGDNNKVENKVA